MSDEPQKEPKDENKMSDKFVTPDKNAIIIKRKKKTDRQKRPSVRLRGSQLIQL